MATTQQTPVSDPKLINTPTHPMALKPGKQLSEGKYIITIKKLLGYNSQGFTYRASARAKARSRQAWRWW